MFLADDYFCTQNRKSKPKAPFKRDPSKISDQEDLIPMGGPKLESWNFQSALCAKQIFWRVAGEADLAAGAAGGGGLRISAHR